MLKTLIQRRRHPTTAIRALVHTAAAVRYQTRILNADGTVHSTRPWKRNLILDQGLDNAASISWSNLFKYCAIGTTADPVKRDSAAITFSRAVATVTASAGFFEAADVGRLLKFDSGEEMYVTGFTSSTVVTVGTSGTIAAAEGTIWYVNQTGLSAESKRTNTTSGGGTFNKTTFSVDTYTHQRQFLFTAETGSVTYREIGWSHGLGTPNLFGRDVIPGAGDSLVAGQQYQVIVTLILTLSPSTIVAAPDVGTGGINTVGEINHQYIANGFSTVEQPDIFSMEPAQDGFGSRVWAQNATFSLNAGISTAGTQMSAGDAIACNRGSYTNGTFTRTLSGVFSVVKAVYTIHGFIWSPAGAVGNGSILALKFTTPFAKDGTHTLSAVLTFTWGRTLVN